jgi:RNA polymerase sigma-54 factor
METSGIRYHCIASIEKDPREPENLFFRFMTPYWARGKYVVQYDRLEDWKKERNLGSENKKKLRHLLKKVELLNMRQDTLFQILSRVTSEQSSFLRSRVGSRRRPLSLRELSRRIGVAPSTVSRAVSNRSVQLPWGEEAPLKSLLTGQRLVILSIMTDWMSDGRLGEGVTDESLMQRLAAESGISVSRRTVNECRRKLGAGRPRA